MHFLRSFAGAKDFTLSSPPFSCAWLHAPLFYVPLAELPFRRQKLGDCILDGSQVEEALTDEDCVSLDVVCSGWQKRTRRSHQTGAFIGCLNLRFVGKLIPSSEPYELAMAVDKSSALSNFETLLISDSAHGLFTFSKKRRHRWVWCRPRLWKCSGGGPSLRSSPLGCRVPTASRKQCA